jgi:hypothetical protein
MIFNGKSKNGERQEITVVVGTVFEDIRLYVDEEHYILVAGIVIEVQSDKIVIALHSGSRLTIHPDAPGALIQ